jgi:carbamoyl-phosphate synthase small subunit
MKAILALADGRIFEGTSFGAQGEVNGEVVFNTSMTGYQEIVTDPSYYGQMVVMTYPLIGNYGVNKEDFESDRPHLSAFIIKELSTVSSNWRSQGTLHDFLTKYGIIGLQGIDTRALTRHIRNKGAQQAVISTKSKNPQILASQASQLPSLEGRDLVKKVTCKKPYDWCEGEWELDHGKTFFKSDPPTPSSYFIVAYDFGIKRNLLRKLVQAGCRVKVVPASTTAKDVLSMKPNGVFLSNGPGDPAGVKYALKNVQYLIGKIPIFGICLGHQILSLALGARTYKLKFGHHGGNQPVINLKTNRVEITAQNHGFAVDPKSLSSDCIITWTNLNDNTVEGIRHKSLPILSIQYHPEASPGPHDSSYLFKEFTELLDLHK